MSFTKRHTVLSTPRAGHAAAQARPEKQFPHQLAPGLRPSPVDGRATTSTGTASLDQLLAGHGGLPMGTCLMVEEQGTTDFSGVLLRYYAAEGLVQGHQVHVVGFPPDWKYQLPALAVPDTKSKSTQPAAPPEEKMKIAWRYEALRNADTGVAAVRGDGSIFCHSFDLSKRLSSSSCKGSLFSTPTTGPQTLNSAANSTTSPFKAIIKHLRTMLGASPPTEIHRVVVPNLLHPSMYSSMCSQPAEVLQFLHALRALLRQYSSQLTALITLPTSLFPRRSGSVRWMELLCDGVVELIPLPANPAAAEPSAKKDGRNDEQPQGLLRIHSLPVYHEKGGGGAETSSEFRENLSFSLSASKGLVIKPYSLPPMLAEDDQKEKSPASTIKDGIDF